MRTLLRSHGKKILHFCISGASGACIDLGSLYLLHEWFGINERIAFIPSSLIACVAVFLFNRHITFRAHDGRATHQAYKFIAVYAGAIILNILLSQVFFSLFQTLLSSMPSIERYAYLLGKGLAIGIGAILNYILSVTFIFSSRPQRQTA